jgi:hypothetical protein
LLCRTVCCFVDIGEVARLSELLAQALSEPRLRTMMSHFLGSLHSDKPLFRSRHHIDVPPLGEEELREVVSRRTCGR